MNGKNTMIRERDANQRRIYELEMEFKELKLNFASLGKQYQLAESDGDAKERELENIAGKVPSLEAVVDEKEKDL